MSKKVIISVCNTPLRDLVKDNFSDDIYNKAIGKDDPISLLPPYLYNDRLAEILNDDNNIPIDFSNNTRILELPDGYDIIENFDDSDEVQVSVIIGKDMTEILTYDIENNTNPSDMDRMIDRFIIPFTFE